jgi:transcription elongation factor GreA
MSDLVPMTRAGYDKLKADLDHMQNVEMPVLEDRVGKARADGDLSENAEYHGARESLQLFRARVNELRDKLSRAAIVDTSRVAKDEVAFGATVAVKDLDCDEDEEFTLVGAGEEDYAAGKILVTSPLAQGLVGKKVGDRAEIKVPKGTIRYQILAIRYTE